jgi:hypothetical protein
MYFMHNNGIEYTLLITKTNLYLKAINLYSS